MKFGDPVTNVCASASNPRRHGYFVRRTYSKGGKWIQCTDGKGKFWEADAEVVFAGHLDDAECKRLFAPIWERRFGTK